MYKLSKLSNKPSLSSCKSLLYDNGNPFKTNKIDISEPIILPDFPLASSAASGFLFCGIIDDPVENLSESLIKLN